MGIDTRDNIEGLIGTLAEARKGKVAQRAARERHARLRVCYSEHQDPCIAARNTPFSCSMSGVEHCLDLRDPVRRDEMVVVHGPAFLTEALSTLRAQSARHGPYKRLACATGRVAESALKIWRPSAFLA